MHFLGGAFSFHLDILVHYRNNLELPFKRLQQSQASVTTNTAILEVSVPQNVSTGSKGMPQAVLVKTILVLLCRDFLPISQQPLLLCCEDFKYDLNKTRYANQVQTPNMLFC